MAVINDVDKECSTIDVIVFGVYDGAEIIARSNNIPALREKRHALLGKLELPIKTTIRFSSNCQGRHIYLVKEVWHNDVKFIACLQYHPKADKRNRDAYDCVGVLFHNVILCGEDIHNMINYYESKFLAGSDIYDKSSENAIEFIIEPSLIKQGIRSVELIDASAKRATLAFFVEVGENMCYEGSLYGGGWLFDKMLPFVVNTPASEIYAGFRGDIEVINDDMEVLSIQRLDKALRNNSKWKQKSHGQNNQEKKGENDAINLKELCKELDSEISKLKANYIDAINVLNSMSKKVNDIKRYAEKVDATSSINVSTPIAGKISKILSWLNS